MHKIHERHVKAAQAATTPAALRPLLQNAIELEHATLPPYLTAMFSLESGENDEVRQIIRSVAVEEMLHLSIACNVMNALGGEPAINGPRFIPSYPGKLPMGIEDGLTVHLAAYSPDVARNTFMVIEEPEDPIGIRGLAAPTNGARTIGEYYQEIQQRIHDLPDDDLPGDPKRQLASEKLFPTAELFPIRTRKDACDAIDIIVRQGEGTKRSPLDPDGGYAHYYRFEELAEGRRIVPDPDDPGQYSFGPPIAFDPDAVHPIVTDTKIADLTAGSEARRLASEFAVVYSKLLNGLHRAFNGEPDFIDRTIEWMFDLKQAGERLAGVEYPGRPGKTVGLPFEYVEAGT